MRSMIFWAVKIGLVIHYVDLSEAFLDKVDMSGERSFYVHDIRLFWSDEDLEFRTDGFGIIFYEESFYRFVFGFTVRFCGKS